MDMLKCHATSLCVQCTCRHRDAGRKQKRLNLKSSLILVALKPLFRPEHAPHRRPSSARACVLYALSRCDCIQNRREAVSEYVLAALVPCAHTRARTRPCAGERHMAHGTHGADLVGGCVNSCGVRVVSRAARDCLGRAGRGTGIPSFPTFLRHVRLDACHEVRQEGCFV